jgi:hypothetical protein
MESQMKPNKAHHGNGQKEPVDPAKIAPTSRCSKKVLKSEDYWLKCASHQEKGLDQDRA